MNLATFLNQKPKPRCGPGGHVRLLRRRGAAVHRRRQRLLLPARIQLQLHAPEAARAVQGLHVLPAQHDALPRQLSPHIVLRGRDPVRPQLLRRRTPLRCAAIPWEACDAGATFRGPWHSISLHPCGAGFTLQRGCNLRADDEKELNTATT